MIFNDFFINFKGIVIKLGRIFEEKKKKIMKEECIMIKFKRVKVIINVIKDLNFCFSFLVF